MNQSSRSFQVEDPSRKLKTPRNLRPYDKQVLTWDQLRDILATAARRDRLLLMLDMTEALCPSKLFAPGWQSFDNENTLSLNWRRISFKRWWAQQDSNLRLPPCEGGTLPLSYAPRIRSRSRNHLTGRVRPL
jgi:integrase